MNKIFQVEKLSTITENTFSLAGRVIAGNSIHKGEAFNLMKIDNNTLVEVNFLLKQIEMYGRSIDFIVTHECSFIPDYSAVSAAKIDFSA
ncbi:MAG: hypothetical protein ACFN00_07785, partial [Flavobacteriaceae bacterium]